MRGKVLPDRQDRLEVLFASSFFPCGSTLSLWAQALSLLAIVSMLWCFPVGFCSVFSLTSASEELGIFRLVSRLGSFLSLRTLGSFISTATCFGVEAL